MIIEVHHMYTYVPFAMYVQHTLQYYKLNYGLVFNGTKVASFMDIIYSFLGFRRGTQKDDRFFCHAKPGVNGLRNWEVSVLTGTTKKGLSKKLSRSVHTVSQRSLLG